MNRRVLITGLVVILPLVAVLWANLGRNPQAIETPLVGKAAPPFILPPLSGDDEPVSLTSYRRRPVVLNFWASWCVPCQAEHPILVEAARANPDVAFLGIVYQDEPAQARAFLEALGTAYPSLLDPESKVAIDYGIAGVPETYFIDASGRIIAKHVSPLSEQALAEGLALLRKGA